MAETSIEWATHVFNAFTGCDRISPGCANCYALDAAASLKRRELGRMAKAFAQGKPEPKTRYQNDGDPKTSGPGFGFTVHWDKLNNFNFPAGARVFVNSMSDVFHEEAPVEAIAKLWAAFASKPAVRWLVLTKRPERMREILMDDEFKLNTSRLVAGDTLMPIEWPLPNVWLGVSIENRRFVGRADVLRETPSAIRFISAEPLLGPLIYDGIWKGRSVGLSTMRAKRCWADGFEGPELDLTDIDWLIIGGESGAKHRRFDLQWARDLRDVCLEQDWRCECGDLNRYHEAFCYRCGAGQPEEGARTAFFMKQTGGRFPGGEIEDLPEDLRIRDFPQAAPVGAS